jgi:hypothetical protein
MVRFLLGAPLAITTLFVLAAPAVADERLPLNPAVTQATIQSTICMTGWTRAVRTPFAIIDRIKSEKLRAVGFIDADRSRFQLDYIIPLSLGGAPDDRRNFQLQRWGEAAEKDMLEACLQRLVCAERVTLDEARGAIWRDWRASKKLCPE